MSSKTDPNADVQDQDESGAGEEAAPKLNLDVRIEDRSACQRHISVTIPREDIDRYFDNAFSDLMPKAAVPGFRAGRAPRKLVENRYRKDVADQIKGSLLLDSLSQLTDDHKLAAISEPDLDPGSIEVPDEGPMVFEFDLEVRPEFELPEWRGLTIERPTREFSDADVEKRLKQLLAKHGKLTPHEGPAAAGDYISANITFKNGEETLSMASEVMIRIRPVLSFRDGKVEDFEKLMVGVSAGEQRQGSAKLTQDAPNAALRGQEITAVFDVLEVKKLELPELTPALLEELGGFGSEEDLREAVKKSLERQLSYQQQQRARQQVLAALTVAADWELPPELVKRQSHRELQRSVLELRRSGFSDAEIRAHENELRQNSQAVTKRLLKEHFILERIAEAEDVQDSPADYDTEIALLAAQSNESPRRVRSQLEKRGLMDTLRNQIIERKTIELILAQAKFKDVPFQLETTDAEAVDQAAGGEQESSDIPEAMYSGEAATLPDMKDAAKGRS